MSDVENPANVGRLFWWKPADYETGIPVRLVHPPNSRGDFVVATLTGYTAIAGKGARIAMLPPTWQEHNGLVVKPVTQEELDGLRY